MDKKKPLSITYAEFNHNIINLINNSQLPSFVLEMVLRNLCSELHSLSQQQLELDKKEYEKTTIKDSNKPEAKQ